MQHEYYNSLTFQSFGQLKLGEKTWCCDGDETIFHEKAFLRRFINDIIPINLQNGFKAYELLP